MEAEGAAWSNRLPASADGLWAWCLNASQGMLLDLLAFLAALTVDAVEAKDAGRNPAADALATALPLEMAA